MPERLRPPGVETEVHAELLLQREQYAQWLAGAFECRGEIRYKGNVDRPSHNVTQGRSEHGPLIRMYPYIGLTSANQALMERMSDVFAGTIAQDGEKNSWHLRIAASEIPALTRLMQPYSLSHRQMLLAFMNQTHNVQPEQLPTVEQYVTLFRERPFVLAGAVEMLTAGQRKDRLIDRGIRFRGENGTLFEALARRYTIHAIVQVGTSSPTQCELQVGKRQSQDILQDIEPYRILPFSLLS